VAIGTPVAHLPKVPDGGGRLSATLGEALGIRPETGEYYEFGLGVDGVLLVAQVADSAATEVRAVLGGLPQRPSRKA